ncbi:uncharacterized protein NEMAJ01_0098 [Nematocida major]|uniref:uncharacterized protein n=1 Tax=Nematocida major TaxID=1912982 RepID=UPI002008B01B|nr:uncharacterized protein NEMAJ01_0098 [Nematocida major]KAH9385202.1 hypothetical protein NEMAJ01_0098 [Nematocida major]
MNKTDGDILEEFRQRRLKELQQQITLKEITDETLLCKKTKSETLIVHFYNKNFQRCKEMNRVLEEIAPKYPAVQFLCAEADKFPFITERLEIKQLPYLATFMQGYFTGGIIGFQDIGEEHLDKGLLEQYIVQSGLLDKKASESDQ